MTNNRKATIENTNNSRDEQNEKCIEIAVNGTLMRGLELEPNLISLEAKFVREDLTESAYRLFSIDDLHPGMVRVPASGLENVIPISVAVEIWCMPASGVAKLLQKEPPGLSIGRIKLKDGKTKILGVLAEPALIVGKKDISDFPGAGIANFRDYIIYEGMRITYEAMRKKISLTGDELVTLKKFRNAAQLLRKDCKLREAIVLLNYCVKKLGLNNRLFQNIPNSSSESFVLAKHLRLGHKELVK